VAVVLSVVAAAAAALAAAIGALPVLASGLVAADRAFNLVWLSASLAAFAVSSVRRHRWPWGAAVALSIGAGVVALIVASVALAHRSSRLAIAAVAVTCGAALVVFAYLRPATRAWHGFACPRCRAFRWPMQSQAARGPCGSCGAPGPARGVGAALPRWAAGTFLLAWIASSLLTTAGKLRASRAERAERARLVESDVDIDLVGWEGFEGAVASVAHFTGARPLGLGPGTCARAPIAERDGRAFVLDGDLAERILAGSHGSFRERGIYLFRCERGGRTERRKDVLALMPTQDPRVVIERLGTGAPRVGLTPEDVVARLEALAAEASFEVTEVGLDYVAGRFDGVPKETGPLAELILAAAPATRRLTDAETLAEELRLNAALYLWWPDDAAAPVGSGRHDQTGAPGSPALP
jgi:hypothetical protein